MPTLTHVRSPVIPGSVQHVLLACPTTDKYHAPMVATLFEAATALYRAGVMADLCLEVGNCHVDDARNSLVRHFKHHTACTDLIFIDADVGAAADDVVKLCGFDRDIVAGVYPKKTDEEEYPVALASGVELWADADGCVSKGVLGVPTGFMRIRRNVIEAMLEVFKARSFMGQGAKPNEPLYTVLFERELVNGKRYSGDYNFCRRWIEMGGTIAVDPSMTFVHEGLKQWRGELGAHWRRAHGVDDQAFASAVEYIRRGDIGPETITALWQGWGNPIFAGEPEMLVAAYRLAKRARRPILECGSGLSTIVMALANPNVEIHALEHDHIWAMKTRDAAGRFGLTNVRLHVHDLKRYQSGLWYDLAGVPDHEWALVVCDGPPMRYGRRAILLEALGTRIERADLLVDDINDAALAEAFGTWTSARARPLKIVEGDRKSFGFSLVPDVVERPFNEVQRSAAE